MQLTKPGGVAERGDSHWPNIFIFPKELREAIPEYGARALVFDDVSGAPRSWPAAVSGFAGAVPGDDRPRAQVRFLVHETGAFDGKFPLLLDIDTRTLRALGRFFVELADQADAES